MTRAERKALRAAAKVVARAVIAESAKFSERIPASVTIVPRAKGRGLSVRCGGPQAPSAYPNDPPGGHGLRNPVFATGPRNTWRWVPHVYRPFMEDAAKLSATEAANVYADGIAEWGNVIGSDRP
jgi:hypothetical protein